MVLTLNSLIRLNDIDDNVKIAMIAISLMIFFRIMIVGNNIINLNGLQI